MTNNKYYNMNYVYLLVLLSALTSRLIFILYSPTGGGDWFIYSTVAENILSGCGVSLSVPNSDDCVPHFGGNQGPGYPIFVFLSWFIGGHEDMYIRLFQLSFYIAGLLYLVRAIKIYTLSSKVALWVGMVLALSPLEAAWPRYLQTETLVLAGTLWVFAELLLSLHQNKIRVVPIAIALVFTTFIRLDAVLLIAPVVTTLFIIHKPVCILKKGLLMAIIFSLPWSAWLIRNYTVGMDNILPSQMALPQNAKAPDGYLKWCKTWTTLEYQRPGSQWPITRFVYENISIDHNIYATEEERIKVGKLIKDLKKYTGKSFPKYIDDEFLIIANERINNNPVDYYLIKPMHRIWSLWTNIYGSYGWPTELPGYVSDQERLEVSRGGMLQKIDFALKHPVIASGKIIVNLWKIVLYLLFIVTLFKVISAHKKTILYPLVLLVINFIVARSLFSGYANFVETRYTIAVMPIMEILVIMFYLKMEYINSAQESNNKKKSSLVVK
jgi:4-amino-4-deoxy-L-arabinose transferase-like glycosyltransferase